MSVPAIIINQTAILDLQERLTELKREVDEIEREIKRLSGWAGRSGGVSDHGLLSGLDGDDHVQYVPVDGLVRQLADAGYPNALLLDGSRKMTGALEFETPGSGYDQILSKTVKVKFHPTAAAIYWRNLADSAYASFYAGSCNFSSLYGLTSTVVVAPQNVDSSQLQFQARDNDIDTLVECARLLSAAEPEFRISRAGDLTLLAGKSLDAYTNVGYIKPGRVSQAAQPTPQSAELRVWHDPDDDKTYLVYNDPSVGVRKIELL